MDANPAAPHVRPPARSPRAPGIAALTDALAGLTIGPDGTAHDSVAAMTELLRDLSDLLALPPARPSLGQRLWGRLPGDEAPGTEPDAAIARLRNKIELAEGRAIAMDRIAADAGSLPSEGRDAAARAQLLAAARAAARAERAAARWGREFIQATLPLWRSTRDLAGLRAVLTAALAKAPR